MRPCIVTFGPSSRRQPRSNLGSRKETLDRPRPTARARGRRARGGGGPCAQSRRTRVRRRRLACARRRAGRDRGRGGRRGRDRRRAGRRAGRRRVHVGHGAQGARHAPAARPQQPDRADRDRQALRAGVRRRRPVAGPHLGPRGGARAGARRRRRRRVRQRTDADRPPRRGMGGGAMIAAILVALVAIIAIGLMLAGASVRVLREYERGVVFRMGRLIALKGPGLVLLTPAIDRMVRVSLRTVTLNVPPQDVITRDNVPARVDAVVYFRVVDPNQAVVQVESFLKATSQIAQTTLRSVLGKVDLDSLLSEREELNEELQKIIDDQTEPWGVKVTTVEIKDVGIPQAMQKAMARQAEAERERRAKVINAEGEFQAAARLSQAADVISQNPTTIQLRYLQTLSEIGTNQNSTIVSPLDLVKPLLEAVKASPGAPAQAELPRGNGTTPLINGPVAPQGEAQR